MYVSERTVRYLLKYSILNTMYSTNALQQHKALLQCTRNTHLHLYTRTLPRTRSTVGVAVIAKDTTNSRYEYYLF